MAQTTIQGSYLGANTVDSTKIALGSGGGGGGGADGAGGGGQAAAGAVKIWCW